VDAGISGKTSCDLDDRENLYSLRYANYAVQNSDLLSACLRPFGLHQECDMRVSG
jgi:hypothetical protein